MSDNFRQLRSSFLTSIVTKPSKLEGHFLSLIPLGSAHWSHFFQFGFWQNDCSDALILSCYKSWYLHTCYIYFFWLALALIIRSINACFQSQWVIVISILAKIIQIIKPSYRTLQQTKAWKFCRTAVSRISVITLTDLKNRNQWKRRVREHLLITDHVRLQQRPRNLTQPSWTSLLELHLASSGALRSFCQRAVSSSSSQRTGVCNKMEGKLVVAVATTDDDQSKQVSQEMSDLVLRCRRGNVDAKRTYRLMRGETQLLLFNLCVCVWTRHQESVWEAHLTNTRTFKPDPQSLSPKSSQMSSLCSVYHLGTKKEKRNHTCLYQHFRCMLVNKNSPFLLTLKTLWRRPREDFIKTWLPKNIRAGMEAENNCNTGPIGSRGWDGTDGSLLENKHQTSSRFDLDPHSGLDHLPEQCVRAGL